MSIKAANGDSNSQTGGGQQSQNQAPVVSMDLPAGRVFSFLLRSWLKEFKRDLKIRSWR
jgi:hypothetical protein